MEHLRELSNKIGKIVLQSTQAGALDPTLLPFWIKLWKHSQLSACIQAKQETVEEQDPLGWLDDLFLEASLLYRFFQD